MTHGPESVEVSIIIPCLNGAGEIRGQLDALASECVDVSWEVIVADNGSTDISREVCLEYRQRLPLQIVDASDRRGQAHARNAGVRRSRGQKLLFLDQDDVISAGYIGAMCSAVEQHRLVAATMDYDRLNPPWALEARGSAIASGLRPGLFPWAYGCVLGVDRNLFDAVGGFDEKLRCAEDIDLCWRLRCQAATDLVLVSGAVLHYRLKTSPRALFAQGVLYGRGAASLYRRWGSAGMARRSFLGAARSWAAIIWRLATARELGSRAAGWYLLGNRLGCALGSIKERVLFL